MLNDLTAQVIVITGAGTGMGRETARLLAQYGATVVLVGRNRDTLAGIETAIRDGGGTAHAKPCDITDPAAVQQLIDWVHTELGPIDVLINNAGSNCAVMNPMYLPEDQLHAVLDTNLVSVFRLVRLVLPGMVERGGGTILTVSSLAAVNPGLLGGAAYGAAKAGVRNFMTFLHSTFRSDGIRAITVLPGEADTPILDNRPRPPAADERIHMLQPGDVAEAIVLAVRLPARACAQEIVVAPTRQRDTSSDVALSRSIGAPLADN